MKPAQTLQDHIFYSLMYFDPVRWCEFGRADDYDLVAEQIAERCWHARYEQDMVYVVYNALVDYNHPTLTPEVKSLEPIAADIWNIRKDFKV